MTESHRIYCNMDVEIFRCLHRLYMESFLEPSSNNGHDAMKDWRHRNHMRHVGNSLVLRIYCIFFALQELVRHLVQVDLQQQVGLKQRLELPDHNLQV